MGKTWVKMRAHLAFYSWIIYLVRCDDGLIKLRLNEMQTKVGSSYQAVSSKIYCLKQQ